MNLTLPASLCSTFVAALPKPPTAGIARLSWLLLVPVALLLSGDAAPGAALWPAEPLVRSLVLLFAGGMLSGLLAGLLGIGGALVTIPVLYLALPALGIGPTLVPATAVATALMAMVPITLMAAWRQHRRGAIEIDWLRRLAAPIAVGAACGAMLAATLNGPVLALMFAAQSCWYGAQLLANRRATDGAGERGLWQRFVQMPAWLAAPPMSAFCACVGMGGGSLITPFLLGRGVPFRHAVATAGALNLCISLAGSVAFALTRTGPGSAEVCIPAAVLLAGGAMVSVSLGVALAHRVPAVALQRLIGLVNVVSASLLVQVALR